MRWIADIPAPKVRQREDSNGPRNSLEADVGHCILAINLIAQALMATADVREVRREMVPSSMAGNAVIWRSFWEIMCSQKEKKCSHLSTQ